MKIVKDFSPVSLVLETKEEVEFILWMVSFAKQTVRAESDPQVMQQLTYLLQSL